MKRRSLYALRWLATYGTNVESALARELIQVRGESFTPIPWSERLWDSKRDREGR